MTLVESMTEPALSRGDGVSMYHTPREKLIREAAQEDGIVHAAPSRTRSNYLLNVVFELASSPKTDLQRGIFLNIAERILNMGMNL
jgi:hypothetical protein